MEINSVPYKKENLLFCSVIIVTFMIGFDTTGLGVAIPDIATTLGFGIKQGAWLSISYTAGFAAFLLPAGIITDRVSGRLTLLAALFVFVVTSLYSIFCVSLESFTAIRLIQGISAAFLNTSAMATLNFLYPVGQEDRTMAFKKWSMFLGLSFALGPALGSVIVTYASWEWIMLINIPLGIMALLPFAGTTLSDNASAAALKRVSLLSTLPAAILLLLMILYQYAKKIVEVHGKLAVDSLIVLCIVSLFVFHLTSERSFTRLPELKSRPFLISLFLPIIFSISYWSLFIVTPGYFTVRMDLSTMQIMFLMLLLSLPLTLVPVFKIEQKWRLKATGGFLLLTIGLLLLATAFATSTRENLLISAAAFVLLGTGAATLNPIMARIVMDNVALEHSGLAAALTSTLRQTGFVAGVAFFSLLTESEFPSTLHFTESDALLFASALPLIALAICIGLDKWS